MGEFYLITFKNTHDAMAAEKFLNKCSVKLVIMPTPTYMTKSCGISIKLSVEDSELIIKLIKAGELVIKDLLKYENGKLHNIKVSESE